MVENVPNFKQRTVIDPETGAKTVITTTEIKEGKVTTTNIHTETNIPVHKDPLQSALSGNNTTDKTGNNLSTKAKTVEQEINLAKLQMAKDFLNSENGKAIADDLAKQGKLTNKHKKLLKNAKIDKDAFLQEFNKANGNKIFDQVKLNESRDNMGALANAHLGEDTEEFPQGRASKKDIDVRNPESRTFAQKMFTKKEKQKVEDSKKYSKLGGSKVNIHSSQTAERKAPFLNDISDDIAREGKEFLDAFSAGASIGKRRLKMKLIDENGDAQTVKIKYKKDGSLRKVKVKSDMTGKLKVKAAKDGHIAIKGDLQSNNIMKEAKIEISNKTIIQTDCDDIIDKGELKEVVVKPEPKPETKPVPKPIPKPQPKPIPKPQPVPPPKPQPKPITVSDFRGGRISDVPRQDKNFNTGMVKAGSEVRNMGKYSGRAISAQTLINLWNRPDVNVSTLVQGYCGNAPTAKYEPSTGNGNLNQQNAKFMAGCLIHAYADKQIPGPGNRKVQNYKADYKKLRSLIITAYNRDLKAAKNDQILPYILKEISEHNASVKRRKYNIPGSNNYPISYNELDLPQAILNRYFKK